MLIKEAFPLLVAYSSSELQYFWNTDTLRTFELAQKETEQFLSVMPPIKTVAIYIVLIL